MTAQFVTKKKWTKARNMKFEDFCIVAFDAVHVSVCLGFTHK